MDFSNLKPPKGAKHSKKRVGRGHGSGQGTQAGRGHKGAQSRSGYKSKVGFEGGQMPLKRRVPKRGFHNPFRVEYAVVNLDTLAERFDAGTVVTLDLLRERRLVPPSAKHIKVLGRGEISKALTVRVHKFSGDAAKKIAAAGGAAETDRRKWTVESRKSTWLSTASRTCSPSPSSGSACSSRWACSSCIASGATSRFPA